MDGLHRLLRNIVTSIAQAITIDMLGLQGYSSDEEDGELAIVKESRFRADDC